MHLRRVRARKGDDAPSYAQLVESYRRADGMPATRVIASLGRVTDLEFDNLKVAFSASRTGRRVVGPDDIAALVRAPRVLANLGWLPLAVLRQIAADTGLTGLLHRLLPDDDALLPVRNVVEALVLQRATAPDSKLAAVRWFGTTALPELFGVAPATFNNTRIHRALVELEAAEEGLREALPKLPATGALHALFLDITDTWFEGHGPPMAHPGRDKHDVYRRRVGIILLCDQDGVPLRWRTLPGNYRDKVDLAAMAAEIAGLEWARNCPIAVDRALGNVSSVAALASHGLRFVSAVPAGEYRAWNAADVGDAFAAVPVASDESADDVFARVTTVAREQGFVRDQHHRWVRELGFVAQPTETLHSPRSRAVASLMLSIQLAGNPRGKQALARTSGLSENSLWRIRGLAHLSPLVQQRIIAGLADAVPLADLVHLADLPVAAQVTAFEGLCARNQGRPTLRPTAKRDGRQTDIPRENIRAIAYFNPIHFLEQRHIALAMEARLQTEIEAYNTRITAHPLKNAADKSSAKARFKVERVIAKHSMRDLYTVEVTNATSGTHPRLTLKRNDGSWQRRRRVDGLSVIVAHPNVAGTPSEIADSYFAKDKVEKDFQTIKHVLDLHPIRHRTDAKVRAHVTLCMLALFLQRHLERRLRVDTTAQSATAALATLATCHLNRLETGTDPVYSVTALDPLQNELLKRLNMTDFADDAQVAEMIQRPR